MSTRGGASQQQDHYAILGLQRNASDHDIKKAYKRCARQHHPDKNPGPQQAEAAERFKKVTEAFDVLSDPLKRAAYDKDARSREAAAARAHTQAYEDFDFGLGDAGFGFSVGSRPFGGGLFGNGGPGGGGLFGGSTGIPMADRLLHQVLGGVGMGMGGMGFGGGMGPLGAGLGPNGLFSGPAGRYMGPMGAGAAGASGVGGPTGHRGNGAGGSSQHGGFNTGGRQGPMDVGAGARGVRSQPHSQPQPEPPRAYAHRPRPQQQQQQQEAPTAHVNPTTAGSSTWGAAAPPRPATMPRPTPRSPPSPPAQQQQRTQQPAPQQPAPPPSQPQPQSRGPRTIPVRYVNADSAEPAGPTPVAQPPMATTSPTEPVQPTKPSSPLPQPPGQYGLGLEHYDSHRPPGGDGGAAAAAAQGAFVEPMDVDSPASPANPGTQDSGQSVPARNSSSNNSSADGSGSGIGSGNGDSSGSSSSSSTNSNSKGATVGGNGASTAATAAGAQVPQTELELEVTLEEIYCGATRQIQLRRAVWDFGAGRWIPRDHILDVAIPRGARAGTRLLFRGLGDELPPAQRQQRHQQREAVSGSSGGPVASPGSGPGSGSGTTSRDLVLVLREAPNVRYVRRGDDLITKAIVPLSTALGGGTVHLRRLDGSKVPLALSEIITPDSETILIGEGMPRPEDPQEHGNMIVQYKLEFPRTLTSEQRQAVKVALQPQQPQSQQGAT